MVIAVVTGYAAVFLWLRNKAKKRIALFEEQLPDALDLMVRSLRVGHPINAAISIVAREMRDPLGTEFGSDRRRGHLWDASDRRAGPHGGAGARPRSEASWPLRSTSRRLRAATWPRSWMGCLR